MRTAGFLEKGPITFCPFCEMNAFYPSVYVKDLSDESFLTPIGNCSECGSLLPEDQKFDLGLRFVCIYCDKLNVICQEPNCIEKNESNVFYIHEHRDITCIYCLNEMKNGAVLNERNNRQFLTFHVWPKE